MANKAKAKGTAAETKVARYLSGHGLPTKRKALAGTLDEGDLRMTLPDGREVTLEVKTGKQTWNYNRRQKIDWMWQTLVEGVNSRCPSVLIIVRYRRLFRDSEVWIPNKLWGHDSWTMYHIDDFAEMCREGRFPKGG